MNELFPIIRRKRRPLLPVESPVPVPAADNIQQPPSNPEPLTQSSQSLLTSAATEEKLSDDEVA
jgi:hypothetical protein